MKIYALTGKSGTGKSFQAMALCEEKQITAIIDDGLFIFQNQVAAGISAKRQKTRVGAIKTAMFTDDRHCESVKKAIAEADPDSILVIGTSDNMAKKIAARLELPEISEIIHIEEITTERERQIAEHQRLQQGKHVIPVPAPQLKRAFAGYFMDPLRIFHGGLFSGDKPPERTVVRPTFSYHGDFFISDTVLTDIARCVAKETPGVAKVLKVYENTAPDSLNLDVKIAMKMVPDFWAIAADYQHALAREVEYMTAFNVVTVDVDVKQIVFQE